MTHLLDTNICSAHMRRPGGLAHRFFQHAGGLAISTVVLSELYAGAYKHPDPDRLLALIADLLPEVTVLDFDQACARQFGKVKGESLTKGVSIPVGVPGTPYSTLDVDCLTPPAAVGRMFAISMLCE